MIKMVVFLNKAMEKRKENLFIKVEDQSEHSVQSGFQLLKRISQSSSSSISD